MAARISSPGILLKLGASRYDVDYRHVTKVGIVDAVELVVLDENLKIVDLRWPTLGIVD